MFTTGPSIIEWLLVSPGPEAAAVSQWERRPFTLLHLLALVFGTLEQMRQRWCLGSVCLPTVSCLAEMRGGRAVDLTIS